MLLPSTKRWIDPRQSLLGRFQMFARAEWMQLLLASRDCGEKALSASIRRRRTQHDSLERRAERAEETDFGQSRFGHAAPRRAAPRHATPRHATPRHARQTDRGTDTDTHRYRERLESKRPRINGDVRSSKLTKGSHVTSEV